VLPSSDIITYSGKSPVGDLTDSGHGGDGDTEYVLRRDAFTDGADEQGQKGMSRTGSERLWPVKLKALPLEQRYTGRDYRPRRSD
jgi:hypothetical protein